MIDKDDSGTLDKAEIVDAVKNDKKVIKFLCNCGNQNLQYLLVPSRLDKALAEMDTDRDGTIDADEWEQCIEIALQNKLAARAAKRELDAKNAAKEIEAFTSDFLNAARKCFNLIDKDMSGTLEIDEIIQAVKTDQVAHAASYDRAPFDLRGLRRTAVFVCLVCGGAESDDSSNYEHTHTQRNNRTTASKFAPFAGSDQVPRDVRRAEPPVPHAARAPQEGAGSARRGRLGRD